MDGRLGTYREIDTLGKSQLDLILQVYDGAIRAMSDARAHYDRSESQPAYDAMERAKKFVMHLYTTLSFDKGEEIADHLGRLYVYVLNQVNIIQATGNVAEIDSALKVLRNLRGGWAELRKGQALEHHTTGTEFEAAPAGQFTVSA